MDKRVMFAVAGAGKTTHIINSLTESQRAVVLTYTDANYENLMRKIRQKFNGNIPRNIFVTTYFRFLYSFCYKPFLADEICARGITYENPISKYASQNDLCYFITRNGYFYSNRLSLFVQKKSPVEAIIERLEKYFDILIIDEIQDISGRDFNLLQHLMKAQIDMLFVGDFYQHTYDTSRDGNVNKSLFINKESYEKRFTEQGLSCDNSTLINSWRCSPGVCEFVTHHLGIKIQSNRKTVDDSVIKFISDPSDINEVLKDNNIIKLHYQNCHKFGLHRKNWGETKGEDTYDDVCVVLNKATMNKYRAGKLQTLNGLTRNKLYVAITRAHRSVYFIDESVCVQL